MMTSGRLSAVALLWVGALVLLAPTGASAAEWWEHAAADTQDQFNAVKDSVDQTVDTLNTVREKLRDFEQWARQNLKGGELNDALGKVKQAREALNKYTTPLALFRSHAGKAATAIDAFMELNSLAQAARQRQGGDLAAALHVAATVMEKYGSKVPVIGKAIEVYGKLTNGVLDATDRIAKTIRENRNQGLVGPGTYGGADDPMWQALVKKYPDLANSGVLLSPEDVPYVYGPFGQAQGWALIWDPDAKQWHKVNKPPGTIVQIYRERVIAKGRVRPWDLVVLARHYDGLQDRRQAAVEAMELWKRAGKFLAGPVADAFEAVNSRHDWELRWLLRDPEAFIARYSQDGAFHNRVDRYMSELYAEIIARGGKAKSIEKWAAAHGVNLAAPPPAGQQTVNAPQAQGGQQQGQSNAAGQNPGGQTPAPGPVRLSLAFLVDCSGSMSGAKLEAAKRAVATSVARTNDGATEWALLAFGSHSVREVVGFTRSPQAVIQAAQGLSAGGDTPLTYATYKAVAYLARNAHGQQGRLVVLCDGQDNCPERGSTSQQEAMAGLRTLVRVVTPAAAATATGGGKP